MENTFIKKCEICNKEIIYLNKITLQKSIKNNSKCSSCCKIGRNNPNFNIKGENNHLFNKRRIDMLGDNNPAKRLDVRKKISDSCKGKNKIGHKVTDETKKKISIKMKLAHATGKHPGWSHINLQKDRTSYPERFFIKVLENNGLFEKYHIEQKLNVGKYFLDFAIIELKLNIEIDGKQHFINDKNINHDKVRNEYLINNGWKVYRICWAEFTQNTVNIIEHFLKYISNIENETSHFYKIDEIKIVSLPKYGTRQDYLKIIKDDYNLRKEKFIATVLNSNIDYSSNNWNEQLSIIMNISKYKVNRLIKKFMLDFYNDKCYKKNITKKLKHINKNIIKINYDIEDIVLKQQPKYGTREQYFNNAKINYDIEQQKYIDLIKNSDINFTKFGWVNKVSIIINQKPQKVNNWMKKYMLDFYNEKCFKRQVALI